MSNIAKDDDSAPFELPVRDHGLAIGAEGVAIAFRPTFQLAALGASVSLGVGIVAGFFPAIQAARTPIVRALRQG